MGLLSRIAALPDFLTYDVDEYSDDCRILCENDSFVFEINEDVKDVSIRVARAMVADDGSYVSIVAYETEDYAITRWVLDNIEREVSFYIAMLDSHGNEAVRVYYTKRLAKAVPTGHVVGPTRTIGAWSVIFK